MSKQPWIVNHRLAIKRVNENIEFLRTQEQNLETLFKIIFIHPDYPFLEIMNNYSSKGYTYGDVLKEINQYSSFFNSFLNDSGDYVGLYLDNSKEWIVVFFSLLMSGYKPVLLSTANPFEENKSVINKLKIKYVISDREFEFNDVQIISIKNISLNKEITPSKRPFSNEIVFLTSGSTGTSKIVFYSGKEICQTIFNSQELFSLIPELGKPYKGHVKHLVILPFYHVFGLFAVLLWFSFFNIEFVLPKNLSPKAIKHAVDVTKPTLIFAVPLFWDTIASEINKNISQRGMTKKFQKFLKISSSLQNKFGKCGTGIIKNILFKKHLKEILGPSINFCINGGAALSDKTLFMINAIGYTLVNGYGSTEIGITSFCSNKTFKSRISNSIGTPFKTVEYKIENNLLMVKALSSSKHYIDGDKEYILDNEEYFNTNDAVIYKEDAYYLQGRQDEIVILENGETISIPKMEVNISLPTANEFAIVFDKDKKSLLLVVSYPITANVSKIQEELNNFKNTQYGRMIKGIYFTNESLPKANNIKIKRNELSNLLKNSELFTPLKALEDIGFYQNETSKNNDKILNIVLNAYKKVFPDQNINENSDFFIDLNGDSLKYFLLLSEIENGLNLSIDTSKVNDVPRTPNEFTKIITANYVSNIQNK